MSAVRLTESFAQELGSTGSAGWDLGAMYGVIAELLLNPAVRDAGRLERYLEALPRTPMRDSIERFLDSPTAHDVDEYTQTLELTPPCPLYLGAHLYDEPNSCRGAGACGRNQYMIELKAMYEHFGFDLAGAELPDFLPVMIEFLAISADHPERDGIGLRRRFVDQYLLPGIPPMRKALQKYESVYDLLMEALESVAEEDQERLADDPVWLDPEVKATIPVRMGSPAEVPSSQGLSMTGWER
ncbi:nitrate reductase molybdenum cofactor assembly chaperone [Thiocystis minor]|uniref:nitrate reductase molybdenum cofactor assembly chaperone n=1 Tax=Thiocystis minor TaxID=61597 RepID=UPI001913EF83|nr:molecular chaperone TorD family protein [Thiocystis minor]